MGFERNGWTAWAYRIFRAGFGLDLVVHFAQLLPWGAELFSNAGMLADAALSPLGHVLPSPLWLSDSPLAVTACIALAAALSVAFALGRGDRAAAVGIWFLLACLFGRNPLIANPSLPYVGWLLLAHACVPKVPRRGAPDEADWRMPAAIFAAAWIVMAVGYGYSGLTKLVSPSWLDGSALGWVLQNPLARPTALRELALAAPALLIRCATWGALALELGFPLLALSRRLRPILWTAMLTMHLGLIALVDFADLSLGMVALHAFTFDPAWLARRPQPMQRRQPAAAPC
jgi:hypothetical protein